MGAVKDYLFLKSVLFSLFLTACLGCTTVNDGGNRTVKNSACVFPFRYKQTIYNSCTNRSDEDGYLWCATKVDSRDNYLKGNFGYCDTDCQEDQDNHDLQEEDDSISLRTSAAYGRSCFSSSGYSGTCRSASYCTTRSYSYSRSCGWSYVCCKNSQNRRYKINLPTPPRRKTVRRPWYTSRPRLPPAPLCGLEGSEPFVFGGQLARQGQFPFIVSFVYVERSYVENFCGGVMISSRHILTAGHCFSGNGRTEREVLDDQNIDVRIGLSNLRSREKTGNSANIAKFSLHPDYEEISTGKSTYAINDLAIVTLDRDVTTSSVCLPSENFSTSGKKGVVIGFGKTTKTGPNAGQQESQLRFAYLDEVPKRTCQQAHSKNKIPINQNQMCAGNSEADSCAGDSGGPLLYLNIDYRWTVGGVVSFGSKRCGTGLPGVYSRVDRYRDWIRRETRS